MKYLLIITLVFSSLFANEKQEITLGVGSYYQTQPYKGVDNLLLPTPVIFYDNSLFYVRWTRFGVYFLGDKNDDLSWGFSLTAQPRFYGYDSGDIQGMNERKDSWEGGIAFSMQQDKSYLEVTLLTDLLRNHDSWLGKVEIGHDLKFGNFSFYPSIFASYLSDNFVNYYYGVTQQEANSRGENAYFATSGWQYGAQTYVKYPITDKLSTLLNIKADVLPSSATNSSIVKDKTIYSGLVSLIYSFEY